MIAIAVLNRNGYDRGLAGKIYNDGHGQLGKVHIFWEGHKMLRNLHLTFVLCSASQK